MHYKLLTYHDLHDLVGCHLSGNSILVNTLERHSALQLPYLISPHLCPDLFTLPSRGTTVCLLPFLLFMSSMNNQEHQDPVMQRLKLHCEILKINKWAATFQCDKYHKLLLLQHPGELLMLELEPVAPVGPVVLTDAAIALQQRLDGPSGA